MAPLFSIFLFYFLLFMYGEFSKHLEVRYASRILLYGMAGNLAIMQYISDPVYAGIISVCTLVGTFLYLMTTTTVTWFKRILWIPILMVVQNYTIVYFQPVDLLMITPDFYLEYSHKILREGILLTLGMLSYMQGNQDERLNYTALFLYVAEYSITLER